MKALFLTHPPDTPGSRFRIYKYEKDLHKAGIECKFIPPGWRFFDKYRLSDSNLTKIIYYSNIFLHRISDISKSWNYDVIFIQREIIPHIYPILPIIIKKLNHNIVLDFDDAIWMYHTGRKRNVFNFLRYEKKVPKIIELSKYVIVGNKLLKRYAIRYNENVAIIPTPVDTDEYKPMEYGKPSDKVVVGWSGSQSTNSYLNLLTNVRRILEKRYNITFRVISNNLRHIGYTDDISFVPWSMETEVQELQKLDIGLMPMTDTEWNRHKCNFKMIQYMGVGLPTVCSPIGMNKEIIDEGKNGFFATTDDEWVDKISALIEDATLRKRIGLAGRKTAEKKYSVRANAPKLISVLEKAAINSH